MDLSVWLTFFVASWLISISPGAGALFAMSSGINHGLVRGCVGIIGLILGIWTILTVVGLGLGAFLATSSSAFAIIKWVGVAYLLYLGVQQWRAPAQAMMANTSNDAFDAKSLIFKGWATNATNPKGVLFMLAVVPQFINPKQALLAQYVTIGATLAFTDLVVMIGYTFFAAKVLSLLRSPSQVRWINRLFGGLFVGVAVMLASFRKPG
jgi:homoserine/homoserine lactone efflux protein